MSWKDFNGHRTTSRSQHQYACEYRILRFHDRSPSKSFGSAARPLGEPGMRIRLPEPEMRVKPVWEC
jgi:hypothetical protein